jgi:hypothetical protein
MDWLEQSQTMMKTWMDSQQKIWEGWGEAAKQATATPWEQSLMLWEKNTRQMVDLQGKAFKSMLAAMGGNLMADNPLGKQWLDNLEQMSQSLLKNQGQLWDNWYAMMRQMDPSRNLTEANAHKMMEQWQGMMQQMMTMQAAWAQQLQELPGNDSKK